MQKSLKKIILTSSIVSTGIVSIGSIVATNYTNNTQISNKISSKTINNASSSSSIEFNGKIYNSIEEAIAEYEKANVSVETYICDIYKESSASFNYRKIYLNKNEVHKYDASKIKTAYSTSYGKLTMDAEVSKKSYIDQPIDAYKDKVGNIHYTEKEAQESNARTISFNSMAFYEIDDYSSGSLKKVKINPLNKIDLKELKKLAILNIGKKDSPFSISYQYADEKYWESNITKYVKPSTQNEYIWADENKKSTMDKILYTIDFNGVPLYKINHDWISDNFFVNKYLDIIDNKFYGGQLVDGAKQNPIQYITNFIHSQLNQNSTFFVRDFYNKLFNNIDNISNNFKVDQKGVIYLTKNSGNLFNRDELMTGFISKDISNQSNSQFKDKFLDDTNFSQFGVSEDEINMGLKATKDDDESLLFTNSGTFKSINKYNKALKSILDSSEKLSEQMIKTINNNMVSNLNDIVFLFDKNSVPFKIKYSEYPTSNIYFNESVSSNSISVIESVEEKNEYIQKSVSNSIETIWLVYDKRGGLLSNSFDRQAAIENAISSAEPEIDEEFVYYNKNGKHIKIKNQINELNVLQLNGESYGFVTYQELYNCLYEYVKMSSTENNGTITHPTPPVQETLPFQPSNIETSNISSILSGFSSLDEVNNLTPEQKFEKFGSAFSITSIESWNKFIGNGLTFANKQQTRLSFNNSKIDGTLTEIKTAIMTVTLQNGHTFSDGTNSFTKEVEYTPKTTTLPDNTIDGKNTYSSTQDIVVATSVIIGVLIVAEFVVLTLTILNKRKNSFEEKKFLISITKNNFKKIEFISIFLFCPIF